MKAAPLVEIKHELTNTSHDELVKICLNLSKFKKENKELMTYLLFDSDDEVAFIVSVKTEMKQQFDAINTKTYFYMKKSVRKILRNIKTNIRYSKKKETEIELLIYFCSELKKMNPSIFKNAVLQNIYNRQIEIIKKAISHLHEDLRYDYGMELNEL